MDALNSDLIGENTDFFRFFIFICENQRNLRPHLLLELKPISPIGVVFQNIGIRRGLFAQNQHGGGKLCQKNGFVWL